MKKILLFAAACAALVACNVSNIDKETPAVDGNAFVKGQRVTLTVGNGIGTKAAGTLSGDDISFTWTKGDKIKVMVGEASAEFTLKGEGGSKSGEFEGEMPGSGTTFSAQYPSTEPNLTTQTYDPSHAIASGLMKATATGCTVGSPVELKPEYAVLRLNLYGGAREVSQIVVTGSSAATYTLSISSAVTVGKDKENATPFFIVLPATESFKSAAVTANAITSTTDNTKSYESYGLGYPISASTTFTATEAKSLTAGSILNMKAVSLTTVWAPVNCGYEPKTGDSGAALGYPYGKLYQWGRKYGQGYKDSSYEDADYPGKSSGSQTLEKLTNTSDKLTTHPDGDTYNGKFYWYQSNWYSGSSPAANDLWKEDGSSIYDPCPDGWRVPTNAELTALLGSHTGGNLQDGNHGTLTNIKGKYFDGSTAATPTSGVFLPAAGYRRYYDGGALTRGGSGGYWSSSVRGKYAWGLSFGDGYASLNYYGRADGYSVRCVQE